MKSFVVFIFALLTAAGPAAFAHDSGLHPACPLRLLRIDQMREMDPAELYGQLFKDVQMSGIYRDSKHFVDMEPRHSPAHIFSRYLYEHPTTPAQLRAFVEANFDAPMSPELSLFKARPGMTTADYIRQLWPALTRAAVTAVNPGSSLTEVDGDHVLPGARFRELYYWDSYFTQLGLVEDQQFKTSESTVQIFNNMLLKNGRIDNGTRKYYRNRSQPPFFAFMVTLWQSHHSPQEAVRFLPALKAEYEFWMRGQDRLKSSGAFDRIVRMEDGGVLNRYWVDTAEPRPEAYKEDIEVAHLAMRDLGRSAEEVYRELGAGAESGWDYSTRWMADPSNFASIQTTSLVPIDLNSLLWYLENKIAELSAVEGNLAAAQKFHEAADKRAALIQKYLFDGATGTFRDYNWKKRTVTPELTIAMATPLFVGLANPEQAARVLRLIEGSFLKEGGVLTTLKQSAQQWDGNNGWAPCQWQTYVAAMRYGNRELAEKLRLRWLRTNDLVFAATGEMKEKYDVVNVSKMAGGGEYDPQFGFGWSNGVYKALLNPNRSLQHLLRGN